MLFDSSHELDHRWLAGIAEAADDATPMAAVIAGFDAVAQMFDDRHSFAGVRFRIITAHPELRERELIKLQSLADAIKVALTDQGISLNAATLASQAGVTVFYVAFGRWLEQNDPAALRRLMDESLAELRSVIAAP